MPKYTKTRKFARLSASSRMDKIRKTEKQPTIHINVMRIESLCNLECSFIF